MCKTCETFFAVGAVKSLKEIHSYESSQKENGAPKKTLWKFFPVSLDFQKL